MNAVRLPVVLALAALVLVVAAGAGAEPVTLQAAVERLARQGKIVIYSNDLIAPDQLIDPAGPTLFELAASLERLGLRLVPIGDHWVISEAPQRRVVRLRIRSASGLALSGVEARWNGRRHPLQADRDGWFSIPLSAGSAVTIAAEGYQAKRVPLSGSPAEVVLSPVHLVEKVIVTGTRHRLAGRSTTGTLATLTANDLATIPAVGGDAMRAVTGLPGTSSVGVSAKPWIRGGLQDEMLIRMDGVELLDAYHLADFQSLFSIVDDRSVAAVDVYTGGFPARYGNRMSGVMDITTGRRGRDPQTQIGVSLFSLSASRQGTLNDGNTWYRGSVRRGNLDQVIKRTHRSLGSPRYYDAYGRVEQRIGDSARLSLGTLLSRDDVNVREDATTARSRIDSRYLWTRLDVDHGHGLTSASTLALTWSNRAKREGDVDDDTGNGGFLRHRQKLWKLQGRSDFRVQRNAVVMEFGGEAEYAHSRYDSTAMITRGIIGDVLGGGAVAGHDIHIDPAGWSGGAYWALDVPFAAAWLLQPGLRWDVQGYGDHGSDHQLSPRLGLKYLPTDALSMHVDLGRYWQPRQINELQVADGETRFFHPQRADHFVAGLEWLPASRWKVSVEAYRKRYRQTSPRFENVFNPFVLVPELEPDRLRITPDRARARGADVELTYGSSSGSHASLHYGYMDAEDRLDGTWVPRRWSQRHTVGGIVSWQSPRLTATLAVTWHSGWRAADLPASVPAGTVLGTSVLNNVELPDYLSVDASLQRTWRLGTAEVTASASVTNLTNRHNLAGIEYDAEQIGNTIGFQKTTDSLLPLVPSVGVLITF